MKEHTEVLYNASCPICSREVDHYAKLTAQAALPIRYDDATNPAKLRDWGISAEDAARRFHVRKGGQTYAGIPAFVILWQEIPQTRWLARLVSLPGVHWIAQKGYDHVAAPLLYRMHLRRQRGG
ncbi:MAG: thiol-disulfide oxidoreductase DCC family protein [Sulfitobacter sp.]